MNTLLSLRICSRSMNKNIADEPYEHIIIVLNGVTFSKGMIPKSL